MARVPGYLKTQFNQSVTLIDFALFFQMQNTSSLSIEYSIRLESLSLLRHAHAQEIPPFLDKKAKHKSLVGRFTIQSMSWWFWGLYQPSRIRELNIKV